MDNLWFDINHKEVHSKHTGINCKYFWFGKVPKIEHEEYEHIETNISKDKVYILRVNKLRNFGCVISFKLGIWANRRRYALNFIELFTEKNRKLVLTVPIKNHSWFTLDLSSYSCKRLLDDIIWFNVEKNSDNGRNQTKHKYWKCGFFTVKHFVSSTFILHIFFWKYFYVHVAYSW